MRTVDGEARLKGLQAKQFLKNPYMRQVDSTVRICWGWYSSAIRGMRDSKLCWWIHGRNARPSVTFQFHLRSPPCGWVVGSRLKIAALKSPAQSHRPVFQKKNGTKKSRNYKNKQTHKNQNQRAGNEKKTRYQIAEHYKSEHSKTKEKEEQNKERKK